MIDLEAFDGFKYEEPLVVVDIFGLFNHATVAATLAEPALVDGEHLKVIISQVLCKAAIGLGVRPVAVDIEHHSLAVCLGWVPVGLKKNFFSKLGHWQVEHVLLLEFVFVGELGNNLIGHVLVVIGSGQHGQVGCFPAEDGIVVREGSAFVIHLLALVSGLGLLVELGHN